MLYYFHPFYIFGEVERNMKRKIVGILICMLMIATAIPAVGSLKNSMINATIPSAPLASKAANWTEIQNLLPSDGAANNYFGGSVSIDGDYALIGAENDDDNGAQSGSAYVFVHNGSTWTQQAKILAFDGEAGDNFGHSVSLSGNTAIIGAPYEDTYGEDFGAAYVFTRSGTTWTYKQKLYGRPRPAYFGLSVSLDGDTALFGTPTDNWYPGYNAGMVNWYTRSGDTWTDKGGFIPSDAAIGRYFGFSVSLDSNTALIGAPLDGSSAGIGNGSAYVFTRSGDTWTQRQKLLPSDSVLNDGFGMSVSLDGNTALIGTPNWIPYPQTSGPGYAYVFSNNGTTWTQQAKLSAQDGTKGDLFGMSISLDGDTALIGAPWDDDNGTSSGSAYVFTRTGTTWTQQQKLTASDGTAGDGFGCSVSLLSDTAFIGANLNDDNGANSGSAYIFVRETDTEPPIVNITRPKGIYLFDKEIIPLPSLNFALVVGKVTIIAEANDTQSGIEKVEFYVDNSLGATITTEPYQWLWNTSTGLFGKHTIYVKAFDNAGNEANSTTVNVWRFF